MKGIDVNTLDPILKKRLGNSNRFKPSAEDRKRFHKIRRLLKQKSKK